MHCSHVREILSFIGKPLRSFFAAHLELAFAGKSLNISKNGVSCACMYCHRVASSHVGKTAAAWEAEVKGLLAAGAHMEALSQPGPTEGVVRCYVR